MNLRIPSYVLVSLLAAYLTYLLIPVVRDLCIKKGFLDQPGPRKIHKVPIPRLGGVAFIFAFIFSISVGLIVDQTSWKDNWLGIMGTFMGGLLIFILGLIDDLKNIKPLVKLFWQAVAALIPVLYGLKIEVINLPYYGLIELGFWGIPISVVWVMMITNTFNFLDGLDGLASGIGAISALTFLVLGIVLDLPLATLFAAGILGLTLSFLRYNFYPAKIFMGDSGSLFIGFILGVLSLHWPKSYATLVMFIPILALGVPLVEIITTTLRRIFTGKKFYMADRRHLFHFLLDLGVPHRGVVLIFYAISLQFSIMAVGLVAGKANIVLVLEGLFIILIAIYLSRQVLAGGNNG